MKIPLKSFPIILALELILPLAVILPSIDKIPEPLIVPLTSNSEVGC